MNPIPDILRTSTSDLLDKISLDTFIISDTHFGHKNILSFEPIRKEQMLADGYEDHEEWLIDKWNSTVSSTDTILHLGDFAFKGVQKYIERLNGNIIFVLGNHDAPARATKWHGSEVFNGFFIDNGISVSKVLSDDLMFSGFIKKIEGQKIMFSHYPVYDNDEYDRKNPKLLPRIEALEYLFLKEKCDLNIHGHIHSNTSDFAYSKNASVEHISFKPMRIRELLYK
jgi:calcineurin-like phosphoesterase family protein